MLAFFWLICSAPLRRPQKCLKQKLVTHCSSPQWAVSQHWQNTDKKWKVSPDSFVFPFPTSPQSRVHSLFLSLHLRFLDAEQRRTLSWSVKVSPSTVHRTANSVHRPTYSSVQFSSAHVWLVEGRWGRRAGWCQQDFTEVKLTVTAGEQTWSLVNLLN